MKIYLLSPINLPLLFLYEIVFSIYFPCLFICLICIRHKQNETPIIKTKKKITLKLYEIDNSIDLKTKIIAASNKEIEAFPQASLITVSLSE